MMKKSQLSRRKKVQLWLHLSGQSKAATKKTSEKLPVHSFRTLMTDLATIVKNKFQSNGLEASLRFEKITQPTPLQQKALDLLEVSLICTQ
jgi:hypothetical protein